MPLIPLLNPKPCKPPIPSNVSQSHVWTPIDNYSLQPAPTHDRPHHACRAPARTDRLSACLRADGSRGISHHRCARARHRRHPWSGRIDARWSGAVLAAGHSTALAHSRTVNSCSAIVRRQRGQRPLVGCHNQPFGGEHGTNRSDQLTGKVRTGACCVTPVSASEKNSIRNVNVPFDARSLLSIQ